MHAVFLLMIFLMVFLVFFSPFSRFHGWDRLVKNDWNKRCREGFRWVCPEAWCDSCCIFTLIDVKGESGSKQQQPCYLCYDYFFDCGWTSCHSIISFLNIIVKYYYKCYLLSTTELSFQTSTYIGLEVICENPSQVQECFKPHVSYSLSNTKSSFKSRYSWIGQRLE